MPDHEWEIQWAPRERPIDASVPQSMGPDAALSALSRRSTLLSVFDKVATRRYGFRIGQLGFLIAAQAHSEVVLAPTISPVPLSAGWLLGLINLRGNLVPVFDLHALCGLASLRSQAQSKVLVIESGENAVGFPIDALPVPLGNLKESRQLPTLPEALAASVSAGWTSDGEEVWLELEHQRLFSTVSQYE